MAQRGQPKKYDGDAAERHRQAVKAYRQNISAVNLEVSQETKARWKEAAKANGQTLRGFITSAIEEKIARNS